MDNEISSLTDQLRSLKWWQFYKAPYLTMLIGAKELEKAGIYIALESALTALEIARDALKLIGQASAHMDELIAMLAASISSIFFIKRAALEIGADKSKYIVLKMELCFTLFGQDKKISAGIPTGGNVKGMIISTADSNVSTEVDCELRKYEEATLYAVSESIFDYLSDSDFIYSDCDDCIQCLKDGLDFADKAAVTEAIMEQCYKQAFDGDNPMSDIHSGGMLSRLSEVKAAWQSMFDAVYEINCDAIVKEAEIEMSGREAMLGEDMADISNSLDELKEKAASLRRLQDYIYDNRSRIDGMDRNYITLKDEMKNSPELSMYVSDDEKPSDKHAEKYCLSLFKLFGAQERLYRDAAINSRMFVPNDEESYFINPANEPVLNKLFASVFENAENGRVLADRIRADAAAKSEPHNYRIRI